MSQLFRDQSLLTVDAPTGLGSIGSATVTEILYRKPSGERGYWTATVSGTDLMYNLQEGDIDEVGRWMFQAYVVIGGLKGFGSVKMRLFQKHL